MRLKWLRDTIEDYDYLTELAKLDPEAALALAQQVAPSWTSWARDYPTIEAARELAQEALTAPPPPPPPPPVVTGAIVTLTTPTGVYQWNLESGEVVDLQVQVQAK